MNLLPPSNLKTNAAVSYETLPLFYQNIFSHTEINHSFWLIILESIMSLA